MSKKYNIQSHGTNATCFMLSHQFGQYRGDGKGGLIGSLSNIFSLLMDRIK